MDLVVQRLKEGMNGLAADADRIRRISAWPWIVRACRVIPIRLEPVCRERERLAPCALRATVP